MVISDRYHYVFVELPHTGSTAVSRELRENYSGESILFKHARYSDFIRSCSKNREQYFTFSAIRNPLDEAVTRYVKIKTQQASMPTTRRQQVTRQFVLDNDADFATYYRYRYRLPYNNWSSLAHRDMNHVMRFEYLQDDFREVLQRLNVDQVRSLPVVNKTDGKQAGFAEYYSPDVIEHAKQIFGPFMHEWGYEFPASWGDVHISKWTWQKYRMINPVRNFYWKNLMHHPRLGRLVRSVR